VTQLRDVVYVVCYGSSSILRFNATTRQRLTDIKVRGLRQPRDIAACEQTSQLYITDYLDCIWRVSADGADTRRWWSKSESDAFKPWKLSVTSTRLLVTPHVFNQLMQLDAVGDELRRVQLPQHFVPPFHAVESSTGTFIVSHSNGQLPSQGQISEIDTDGEALRQFTCPSLSMIPYIAVDSHVDVFVADTDNHCILLLDAQLKLRRVIIDEHQLKNKLPGRLCYKEQSGQLLVGCGVVSGDLICYIVG